MDYQMVKMTELDEAASFNNDDQILLLRSNNDVNTINVKNLLLHSHTNKNILDRISINNNNELLIDGKNICGAKIDDTNKTNKTTYSSNKIEAIKEELNNNIANIDLSDYYTKTETDNKYALIAHNHSITDITNLQSALDSKAASNHNHDISYLKLSGGTMTGNITMGNHGISFSTKGSQGIKFGNKQCMSSDALGVTSIDVDLANFNSLSVTDAVKADILKNSDGETLVQKGILADGKGNTLDVTEIGNENKPVVLKTLEKAPRVNGLNFVYHEGNKPTIEELGLTDYVNKTKTMYEEGRTTKFVKFASEANKWGKVAEFNMMAPNACIAATFMVQTVGDNDNNAGYAIFSVNIRQFPVMGKKPTVSITTLLAKNFDAVTNIKGVLVENSSSLTKVELYIRQQILWDGYIITCINGRNFPDCSFTMFENLELLDDVPTGISSTYYKPAYLQNFYTNKDATLAYCEAGADSTSVHQLNDCNVSTTDFVFTASQDGVYRFDVSLQVNTKMVVVAIDGDTSNSLVVLNNAYSGSITLRLKEGQVVKTLYLVPISDTANTYSSIAKIDGARLTITACAV